MTLMVNIGTAFAVLLVSIVILSTNYKTIWPAPNFVTHSATFDYIFADIASNSLIKNPIEIEYAYKSSPIATMTSSLVNNPETTHHDELLKHQSILEKQSNLHHLLHIPPWALVPDRISSTSGTSKDLFKIFDSLANKQENTLSALSDIIEIIPTETIIKTHMEKLTPGQKYWYTLPITFMFLRQTPLLFYLFFPKKQDQKHDTRIIQRVSNNFKLSIDKLCG